MREHSTKTQQALLLFRRGDFKRAFAIFKHFKMSLSKQELRTIEIAHECLTGKENFYSSLGIDTIQMIHDAKGLISKKYAL